MATQHTSLAVKYRPQRFEDVCGQDTVKQILKHQIDTKTFRQAYLMAGHFGTGKTTVARIFAKMVNGCNNDIIEIDAATYNSVDQIRVIADEARKKPLVGKYKIFIIDECFSADSLVSTPYGNVPIKDLKAGDTVYNLLGTTKVTECHKVTVPVERLCCIIAGDKKIITTRDHLFLTRGGWVAAGDLREGDVICGRESLQNMWSAIPGELSERLQANLFGCLQNSSSQTEYSQIIDSLPEDVSNMWKELSDTEKCQCADVLRQVWLCVSQDEQSRDTFMRCMPDSLSMSYEQFEENLQQEMQINFSESAHSSNTEDSNVFYENVRNMWKRICDGVNSKDLLVSVQESVDIENEHRPRGLREGNNANEIEQSFEGSRKPEEDESNQSSARYSSYMDRDTWWQWALYQSAISAIQRAWKRTRIGVSNTDKNTEGEWVSYELQSRPRLSFLNDSDRGGWQFPCIEIPAVAGLQERQPSGGTRVDSVTFYKRGDRSESDFSCFSYKELDSGSVDMYDLTVQGHPSYIVNECAVHNCHSLSQAANNAFLKILEEPPATAMFLLCTTDPQKLLSTILSRVQRYDFTSVPIKLVIERLRYIAKAENIVIDDPSIEYIAKLSGGGMRDAISMLDKVSSLNSNITIDQVASALSVVSYSHHLALLKALIDKDTESAVKIVYNVSDSGSDMRKFMSQFMWTVCDVCNYFIFKSFEYINIPELDEYKQQMNSMNMSDCLTILNWSKQLCADIRNDADPKDNILVSIMLFTNRR